MCSLSGLCQWIDGIYCAVTGYSIACIACKGDDEPCVLINVEMGFMCMYAMDRWGHSVVWLQREAAEGQLCSSPPFSLTHYPGGSVLAPQSGLLLLLINLQEI